MLCRMKISGTCRRLLSALAPRLRRHHSSPEKSTPARPIRTVWAAVAHRLTGLLLATLLLGPHLAVGAPIALVLSEEGGAYEAFANTFGQIIGQSQEPIEIGRIVADRVNARSLPDDTQLIVAIGSNAAEALESLPTRVPLLLAMVPRATYDRVRAKRPLSGGVLIDQPPLRYIQLVRTALPDHPLIGMLAGRDSQESTQRLFGAARELGMRARIETVSDEHDIYPAMQRLPGEGSVLLATPDATIFNSHTIPSILLSAFRRLVPVIGFSPAYVNAGAAIALYSSPEQIATQTADLVRSALAGANPGMQYPRLFTVGINDRVARALGLRLDDSNLIRERLERLERRQ